MPERIPLDLLDVAVVRKRARYVVVAALVLGLVIGELVALLGGFLAGGIAALVVAIPLIVLAVVEARRRVWLESPKVSVRALGTRTVDLHGLTDLDLMVTDVRGNRTIGMLISGAPKGRTINIALATYSAVGGRELGILALRRLADGLSGAGDPGPLVFAELLVAQLRAEARGEDMPGRPLYQLASAVPGGKLAQRIQTDAVTRFVATLDS
ncbi:hypothetical protein [Kutzneria sp. 744]|uniref:hypothetical protein n=1 Tax=Kutzneria sp. (strain 744) TaxID=345341 RepID=UPI0003EEDD2E|nr:hypothetical protein [Kutzneria sp. 744]EWM11817.1 hypothetical protein KUTG_02121 [Kutzneria sp. 744]